MNQTCQLCGGHEPPFTIHPEGTRHTQPIESCIRELARRCRILDETTTRWKVVEAPVADLPNGPKQRTCEKCGEPLVGASAILEAKTCIASNACLARQLSAAVARAEKAERERDEARAELGKILEAGKEFYTEWGRLDHKAYPEVYKLLYSLTPHMKCLKQEAGSGLSQ